MVEASRTLTVKEGWNTTSGDGSEEEFWWDDKGLAESQWTREEGIWRRAQKGTGWREDQSSKPL